MRSRVMLVMMTAALVTAACSGSDGGAAPDPTAGDTSSPAASTDAPDVTPPETTAAPTTTSSVPTVSPVSTVSPDGAQPSISDRFDEVVHDFEISVGVEQITITGATPGTTISFVPSGNLTERLPAGATNEPPPAGEVDAFGSLLLRRASSDFDWHVLTDEGYSAAVRPLDRSDHPPAAFYAEQRLPAGGYGYITMRDGTTLAANVVLPGPADAGPYPTVVEYSGYTPADPDGAGFKDLFVPLGYAYVGVNMRGTGCSGGSFRYFEYVQSLDGYDVIEAVAAQPWVFENRPGMVGVSYPGISQLFVAQTQPPSLAAITPFSVIDDSYNSTLYPGGLLNTGFAVDWTQERIDSGRPAITADGTTTPAGEGQGWAKDRIAAGDETCAANQSLRLQNPDLVAEIFDSPFVDSRPDAAADELSPRSFVDRITVPTFIAGAWQDEQTGGRFPTMLDRFTGTEHLYATLMNGLHTESIGPVNFQRWVEFLDLYVAKRTPSLAGASFIAPLLAGGIFGTSDVGELTDRFAGMTYDEALAAFEAEPPIRVAFEVGAADGTDPLTPLPRFVEAFDAWPIPNLEPTEWWLGAEGSLLDVPEDDNGRVEYLALPDGVPATFFEGASDDVWKIDVDFDWQEPAPGTAANFVSAPLADTLVMAGSGSADLWVTSNLGDTDLEVTLSEVRPDGQEMYVQSGWLRASHRALDDTSTPLRPVHLHTSGAAAAVADGVDDREFDLARVEIFPFAHVFRAGSQIRISVDAPGGNRPVWVFDTISGGERVTIATGGDFASKIVLPVVPGIEAPAAHPACGSLRGQPCR